MKTAVDLKNLCDTLATGLLDEDIISNIRYWAKLREKKLFKFDLDKLSSDDFSAFLYAKLNKKMKRNHPNEMTIILSHKPVRVEFVSISVSFLASLWGIQIKLFMNNEFQSKTIDPTSEILRNEPLALRCQSENGEFSIYTPLQNTVALPDVMEEKATKADIDSDSDSSGDETDTKSDVNVHLQGAIIKLQQELECPDKDESQEWSKKYKEAVAIITNVLEHLKKLDAHVLQKIGSCSGTCPEHCIKAWQKGIKAPRGAAPKLTSKRKLDYIHGEGTSSKNGSAKKFRDY